MNDLYETNKRFRSENSGNLKRFINRFSIFDFAGILKVSLAIGKSDLSRFLNHASCSMALIC